MLSLAGRPQNGTMTQSDCDRAVRHLDAFALVADDTEVVLPCRPALRRRSARRAASIEDVSTGVGGREGAGPRREPVPRPPVDRAARALPAFFSAGV